MLVTRELIDSFHQFAVTQLRNGGAALTIDEVYERWRAELEREETVRTIQIGIDQIERGEGLTIEEAEEQVQNDLRAVRASLRDVAGGETGRAFTDFDRDFRQSYGRADTRNSNSSKR